MKAFRLVVAGVLLLVLAAPVGLPVWAARARPGGAAWAEADRIAGLAGNTLALAAGACLVAVPAGTLVALALERAGVPGRGVLRWLVLVGLFVPLPVYAVAWQVVLGAWLPPLSLEPGQVAWRPWGQGLLPAAWVHGMAGLPWVVWIVSAGLRTADRGLEEDALLTGGPAAVFRRVLLPRAALASVAAAGWVAVQAGDRDPRHRRDDGADVRRGGVHAVRRRVRRLGRRGGGDAPGVGRGGAGRRRGWPGRRRGRSTHRRARRADR